MGGMTLPANFFLPIVLMAVSFAVGAYALLRLIIRTRPKEAEEWRDPPPLIYKLFKPVVRLFSADVRKFMSDASYAKLQSRLSAAGMNYAIMAEEFVTLRFVCAIFCCIVAAVLYQGDIDLSPEVKIFLVLLGPLGYLYPDIWIRDKIAYRRRLVAKEFPFLLDLLVLSMKAGLNYSTSLGQAIASLPHGPVRDEFGKLLREIRAGKVRREALLDLAARMDINSVHNFVSAINQAEETGGEIVDVLTVQAEQRRAERFNEAEAAANKAPVKMLLPMMLFLFPIVFMLVGFIMIVKLAESNLLPEFLLRLLMS
jgi:tight adherence protein C